jgi:hypothetical protein
MTPQEYYDLCDSHDWLYHFHWEAEPIRMGQRERAKLISIANQYGYWDMYERFMLHKVGGEEKPEEPKC